MKIEETITTTRIDLKKLIRRGIRVSADILSETARYGQNIAGILLSEGDENNRPLKHNPTQTAAEKPEGTVTEAFIISAEQSGLVESVPDMGSEPENSGSDPKTR